MFDHGILKILDSFEVGRREFLKQGSGALISLFLGAGLATTSKPAFSGVLSELNVSEANTLLMVARTLFPHDHLDDGYYMNVVAAIDSKCSDSSTLRMVKGAISNLEDGSFSSSSEISRENMLKAIEGSEFFTMMYGETVNGLYLNKEVWQIMGYEGSSKDKGGYLNRGFDDLDWLPKS